MLSTKIVTLAGLTVLGLAGASSARHQPAPGQPRYIQQPYTQPPPRVQPQQHPAPFFQQPGPHPRPAPWQRPPAGPQLNGQPPRPGQWIAGSHPQPFHPSATGGSLLGGKKWAPGTVKAPPAFGGGPVHPASYVATYGAKTGNGSIVYKGLLHQHWTCKHYSPAHRCWCWYDPCTGDWYYWCGARGYYLPVRYVVVVAPTVTGEEAAADVLPPGAAEVPQAEPGEIPDLPELN